MTIVCKNIILSHGKIGCHWSSKIQWLVKSLVKTKRSEFFAVNNGFQNVLGSYSQRGDFAKKMFWN